MVSNRCPFSFSFIFGNRKKSQGAKLRDCGGWGVVTILFSARNCCVRTEVFMVKQPGLFLPKFGATSSHVFTQSLQNVSVEPEIHILACWDKFFVHNPLDVKESDDHAVEIAFHLSGLFWPWWIGALPLGGLLLCLRVVTANPALINSDDPGQEGFIIGCDLTNFSAEVDKLLLLVSCKVPGHKFGCGMVHSQLFPQNPLACPITNYHLLSNVVNGPTSILTYSYWIRVTVSGVVQLLCLPVCSLSSTDVRPVLNRAWHWNTCARLKLWSPKTCWIIVRFSVALFTRLAQNLMHTRCCFFWSIVKIATVHVHDSKQTRVKTTHFYPAMCNLAYWLARHASPAIYRCFALPQLLYRWRHQSRKFWIPPRIL